MNNKHLYKGKKKGKPPNPLHYVPQAPASDSEQSADSNSISGDSQDNQKSAVGVQKSTKKEEWEILEGLKEGQRFEFVPNKFEGFLLKRRKWPLKGWHKRYFILDQAILSYSKNASDLAKGKIHGSIDISLSVVSTKARRKRIDIDADSGILHVKCKSMETYMQWVEQLKQHRLHKQHNLLYVKPLRTLSPTSLSDDSPTDPITSSGIGSAQQSLPSSLPSTLTRDSKPVMKHGVSRVSVGGGGAGGLHWLVDINSLENIGKSINNVRAQVQLLAKSINNEQHGEVATPSTKKRGKFRLRKHKQNKSSGSTGDMQLQVDKGDAETKMTNSLHVEGNMCDLKPLSTSNPSLSQSSNASQSSRPNSCTEVPAAPTPSQGLSENLPEISLDQEFAVLEGTHSGFVKKANIIIDEMSCILKNLEAEKERARQMLETETSLISSHNPTAVIASMRLSLNQALQQNAELRGRLARIHEDSNISGVRSPPNAADTINKSLRNSMSYESSSCFSASEYFDAISGESGDTRSDTSSEISSDNSSVTSEASDTGTDALTSTAEVEEEGKCFTGRRTCLPAPQPSSEDFSLFNLLYKNIGKDLSKLSMPVSLNEPLNMLQRLCEELEYSELLDKAAGIDEPSERMIQVAAFAVSAYASSIYRAAHKPFNPLLGETYENIREDKGFRFIAEQVSHHPPVSVCHAESNSFVFTQDLRIKTKFWGRSLEFQPSGKVQLHLPKWNDIYEWNKVTTCVHNLFGSGVRWVDQYGEMVIRNLSNNLTCKLTFVKASSNSSKRHEVFGAIYDDSGVTLHNLFGKWTEALYCGHAPSARVVWRPGSMPAGYEMYYGFTRFAMELNELDPDLAKLLPSTDSRFRPDQRLLEEGNLNSAGSMKQNLEQLQRERRKGKESEGSLHIPMWFRLDPSTEDSWIYGNDYWHKRKDPGFINMSFESIW